MIWLDTLIQGLLVGGVYALAAVGLALAFGVMRLVNMAHGDVMVTAAYVAFALMGHAFGLMPAMLTAILVMAAAGYGLQRLMLNRTLGADPLPSLLVTFGLSMVVQNVLLLIWTADSRKLSPGPIGEASLTLAPGLQVGVLPLITFALAVIGLVGLQQVFDRTRIGRILRAVSNDPEIAGGMGIDNRHIYALAIALAFGFAALAGLFLAMRSGFSPQAGSGYLILAFEVVVIGGLGRFEGALIGGMILGLAQALAARIDPQWQLLGGHVVFLAVLLVRPNGLFSRGARG
ncbi:branched-chain amino acid ABC transporter permease [Neotabrizicola shimadae]|uniref:Branched-chain amino acid ABC transporter permease n=1 Tax=Neotabrizicola shimadae TaxID=2807096 RepID=A0A8G0ZVD6_9RHOB|nr:branched-chain amino acid ABC transporter permease [Neotabrizicola shimadae]QYZ69591.1 branched-chain amino acid ABC transporter permease [Neotabrizicola shimadae]